MCSLANASMSRVERSSTVSVTMQLNSNIQAGSVLLLWKTFDDLDSKQKDMTRVFGCSGALAQGAQGITVPCTIPLGVPDGHYYLVSVSVQASQFRKTYTWLGDLPTDLAIVVKGGTISMPPKMKSIQIIGTRTSKQ